MEKGHFLFSHLTKKNIWGFTAAKNSVISRQKTSTVPGLRVLPRWPSLLLCGLVARHWLKLSAPPAELWGVQVLVFFSLLSDPPSAVPISDSSPDEGKQEAFPPHLLLLRGEEQNDTAEYLTLWMLQMVVEIKKHPPLFSLLSFTQSCKPVLSVYSVSVYMYV